MIARQESDRVIAGSSSPVQLLVPGCRPHTALLRYACDVRCLGHQLRQSNLGVGLLKALSAVAIESNIPQITEKLYRGKTPNDYSGSWRVFWLFFLFRRKTQFFKHLCNTTSGLKWPSQPWECPECWMCTKQCDVTDNSFQSFNVRLFDSAPVNYLLNMKILCLSSKIFVESKLKFNYWNYFTRISLRDTTTFACTTRYFLRYSKFI